MLICLLLCVRPDLPARSTKMEFETRAQIGGVCTLHRIGKIICMISPGEIGGTRGTRRCDDKYVQNFCLELRLVPMRGWRGSYWNRFWRSRIGLIWRPVAVSCCEDDDEFCVIRVFRDKLRDYHQILKDSEASKELWEEHYFSAKFELSEFYPRLGF